MATIRANGGELAKAKKVNGQLTTHLVLCATGWILKRSDFHHAGDDRPSRGQYSRLKKLKPATIAAGRDHMKATFASLLIGDGWSIDYDGIRASGVTTYDANAKNAARKRLNQYLVNRGF